MLIMNTRLDLTQPAEKYLKIIKRKIFFFLELSASEDISVGDETSLGPLQGKQTHSPGSGYAHPQKR